MNQAKKKLCPACQKRRDENFFEPRARICVICKELKKKSVVRASLPELKRQAQKVFNAYIRRRDAGKGCISCGKAQAEHCGHYISQGSSGLLRYNELNCNLQCAACNVWKRGNLIEYRINLIDKIGKDMVEWLENNRHDVKKWKREELEEIIKKYKDVI